MKHLFAPVALTLALASAAAAQDSSDYNKEMRDFAIAFTSVGGCSERGYDVDTASLALWRQTIREGAVAAGIPADEVDALQNERIEGENANLNQRYINATNSVRGSDRRWKFEKFWNKRCKKLSKAEQTKAVFTKS